VVAYSYRRAVYNECAHDARLVCDDGKVQRRVPVFVVLNIKIIGNLRVQDEPERDVDVRLNDGQVKLSVGRKMYEK